MNFSWYLGFGWLNLILLIGLGFGSWFYSEGWIHWLFYALFALAAAYALTRFRLYKREPWRRVHQRGFEIIRDYIKQTEKRDPPVIAAQLAQTFWGSRADDETIKKVLTESGRKEYYKDLVEDLSMVFTQNVPSEKKQQAKESILKDIQSSQFGPDIVIALEIEKRYGRLESARYLLAMASGYIK